jgi:hypothetical protein
MLWPFSLSVGGLSFGSGLSKHIFLLNKWRCDSKYPPTQIPIVKIKIIIKN